VGRRLRPLNGGAEIRGRQGGKVMEVRVRNLNFMTPGGHHGGRGSTLPSLGKGEKEKRPAGRRGGEWQILLIYIFQ